MADDALTPDTLERLQRLIEEYDAAQKQYHASPAGSQEIHAALYLLRTLPDKIGSLMFTERRRIVAAARNERNLMDILDEVHEFGCFTAGIESDGPERVSSRSLRYRRTNFPKLYDWIRSKTKWMAK